MSELEPFPINEYDGENDSNDDDDDDNLSDSSEGIEVEGPSAQVKTVVTISCTREINSQPTTEILILKPGSNIIRRGHPPFFNDLKISRIHADIIVPIDQSGNVKFIQFGQNHSILYRNRDTPINLYRGGITNQLFNNDKISLYEGGPQFTITIEKGTQQYHMSICDQQNTPLAITTDNTLTHNNNNYN